MTTLHLWIGFSLIFTIVVWKITMPNVKSSAVSIGNMTMPLLFLFAFVLRVVLAGKYSGFGVDIGCFSAWADRMAEIGPSGFYAEDYFSDYPPLYLYCLGLLGTLRKLFALETYSQAHLILLKFPSILADLGIGYIIYRTATKHVGIRSALGMSAIYLFQPVVIMNSCLWGQIDSIFTFLLLLVCVFLDKNMLLPAFLAYGAGVLLKPQMLIFTPILILGVFNNVFGEKFSLKALFQAIAYQLLTMILMLLLSLPFGLENVLPQYFDTLASYPYASVNAYNFWAGMGLNWYPQETLFLGLPCTFFGTCSIFCAAIFSFLVGLRLKKAGERFPLMGAFLIITVFTFSVRMHERYLYPVMALLLLAYPGLASGQLLTQVNTGKKQKTEYGLSFSLKWLYPIVFTSLTCCHFYNTGHVLFFYDPSNYSSSNPVLIFTGIGTTICAILFYVMVVRICFGKEKAVPVSSGKNGVSYASASSGKPALPAIKIAEEHTKMTKCDFGIMAAIVILYSLFAFHDLGDAHAPETYMEIASDSPITLTFPQDQPVSSLAFYMGPEHDRPFQIACVSSGRDADPDEIVEFETTFENVFTWTPVTLPVESKSLSLTLTEGSARLIKLVFLDEDGHEVQPLNKDEYAPLFDEEDEYPSALSFRNSMYFDEIYHARTAYEFIEGLRSYENTHPPFGKVLISLGVRIFGMNPFGWRIIGTLFGIAMLPMIYLFAKKLSGDTPVSALSCFIFAFDFMHFTQTRIATIDVYIVFFIICMYYFLYRYLSQDYMSTPVKALLIPLGLCGLSMGFGVASKWTGVYAGLGMGFLFFLHLFKEYQKNVSTSGKKKTKKDKAEENAFYAKTKTVILFCIGAFVVVPVFIYLMSYIPFRDGSSNSMLKQALDNQNTMYSYHSTLEAEHYFASPFYEWPLIIRPIWYYSGIISDTLREGISAFGNPLVWWCGIPAFFYMIYLYVRKKDKRAFFLIVGYLSQFLPWFMITRLTFIYHYFPSVVFIVLMIGYSFLNLREHLKKRGYIFVFTLYAVGVFGLFLMFYPVLSGQTVDVSYVQVFLKWFRTWVLVAD